MELIIDPELRDLIPSLEDAERDKLEASILKDGCFDAIKVWNDNGRPILLDGHNRKEICDRLELPYRVEEVASVTDRYEAIQWMIDLQLSRRNLTPERKSYLRGRRYNEEKKAHGAESGGRGNQYLVSGNNYHLPDLKTCERLAGDYGVSEKTIRLDSQFAEAVDALPANERIGVLSGRSLKSKRQLIYDHLVATGQRDPPKDKVIEKGYRRNVREALEIIRREMEGHNQEIRCEIVEAVTGFLRNTELIGQEHVTRIWNSVRKGK